MKRSSRRVLYVRYLLLLTTLLFVSTGCSRLDVLTEETLLDAEARWRTNTPGLYRVVVEMSGERVETGIFDALVRDGQVVSLKRNDQVILPDGAQDYSIGGLFRLLGQELALAEQPSLLGAPAGYAAHLLARFDSETGRLERYRRTVTGVNNNIEITILEFEPQ